ncbi:replication initiation protein [Actinobacillus ureae]|uniref:replication initiation protein n=1 Tax=Actinobacillus ureae TaxID=723 RepID=UPI0015F24F70|nr:replication initiation protein [Actinobacillus ureae]
MISLLQTCKPLRNKSASAYEQVKQAVKKIYDRSVKIEDEEKIFEFRWVSSRTYFKREGKFRIALTREVMPYLTQLKGKYYTSYNLEHISTFQSFHSIRIYELLAQFKTQVGDKLPLKN